MSDLIVFAQHSVCDGIALAILIRDTLMHIANPHLEVKMISPSPRTNYMPKSPKNIMIGFLLRPLVSCTNKQWSKRRWLFDQEDFLTIYKAFWQRYKYKIVMLQLEQDETERLIINCREHGVTVGSATSTAFIAAYRDVCGDFKRRQKYVLVPHDLRKRLKKPVGDIFCLFGGLFQFKFNYKPEKSLWEGKRSNV